MAARTRARTSVGIVGGGPAGLMISHLLSLVGIDSVVVEIRDRDTTEKTHRAGILEQQSVRTLLDSGVSDRILRDGHEHQGIDLRFGGESHRIDFQALVGASTWLYPQTEVFIDLADARERDGGQVHFGVTDVSVHDVAARPSIRLKASDGVEHEIECDYLVGADGSQSVCRFEVPEDQRVQYFREYPYAWFGILCEAPPSAPELIYAHSDHGFALISQRTDAIQRMYFQCEPGTVAPAWSDDRIWEQLQLRLAGADGLTLHEGAIIEKSVLPFHSFVQEPMRHGNMLLAGDAAHTVPPTGAKGLNLALADARLVAEVLERAVLKDHAAALDEYGPRALERVWKTQHFSYWMTTMLHSTPTRRPFDSDLRVSGSEIVCVLNQLGEPLKAVVAEEPGVVRGALQS